MGTLRKKRHLSTFQIIILGFFLVIVSGSLLLMLPFATAVYGGAAPMDALFTATSAVCVTGLVLHDTVSYWSLFGQAVILTLIQIGGMGVVTVAVSVAMFAGRKIGLMQRSIMQEAISAPQVGGIVRLTGFILKTTVVIELAGAAVMAPVFCRDFGILKGIWYAVFHSVSAFCNAGFDLLGEKAPFSSLTEYSAQPVINITVMLLILIGGIGFMTWDDIRVNGLHIRKYRMQSKIILTVTTILVVLPALYFYFVEFSGESFRNMSRQERVLGAFFQSVTPRTAGFNTIDLNALSEAGRVILLLLMLIGGSPGSTAGGMKTTTIAVLFLSAMAVFRRKESAQCFGRRLSGDTIGYAATILLMYLTLFLFGGIFISSVEGLPVLDTFFEAASAIGTVGLSLGITGELGILSRFVLIGLMFMGRVGGLTLVYAALSEKQANVSKLPKEKITVG